MNRIVLMMLALAMLSLSACEKKTEAGSTTGATDEAPAEKIVQAEIPEELEQAAQKEINADNAEQALADLEKEIEADTQ